MENRKFAEDLERRTRIFAVGIIQLSSSLPNTSEARVVRNQITKSGTSIGANYRESNRSRSRADFKSKVRICESEASETLYWLTIIKDMKWGCIDICYSECQELLAIFSSIARSLSD